MTDDPSSGTWPILCNRCGAELPPGQASFYVVRIEAFADPSPPADTAEQTLGEPGAEIDELIERMGTMSEQELMDQVYRRLILFLCNGCYRKWIESPTG